MFLLAQQDSTGYRQGVFIGHVLIGLIAGLLIQKFGQKRGLITLSWVAFGLTCLAGLIAGWFGAAPVGIIFALVFAFIPPAAAPKKKGTRRDGPTERFPTRTPDQPYDL